MINTYCRITEYHVMNEFIGIIYLLLFTWGMFYFINLSMTLWKTPSSNFLNMYRLSTREGFENLKQNPFLLKSDDWLIKNTQMTYLFISTGSTNKYINNHRITANVGVITVHNNISIFLFPKETIMLIFNYYKTNNCENFCL